MSSPENQYNADEDSEILQGFVRDSQEMLDEIEPDLIKLQKAAENHGSVDREILNSVFRLFHSLKGAAGYLHLECIINVTHEAETMLNRLRDGSLKSCPVKIDLLIRTCDFIRSVLDELEKSGEEARFQADADDLASEISSMVNPNHTCNSKPAAEMVESNDSAPWNDTLDLSFEEEPENEQFPEVTVDSEMKAEFIKESKEAFDRVELCLMDLEKAESIEESLESAFRDIHSFKGNCGILGLEDPEKLSHKMETVLDHMRSGKVGATPDNVGVLLKMVDVLRDSINSVEEGSSGKIDGSDILIDLLDEIIPVAADEDEVPRLGEILVSRGEISREELNRALEQKNKPLGKILTESGIASERAVESALSRQETLKTKVNVQKDIRVSLEKLDALNDLVGELVIAQLMVTRNPDLKGQQLESFEKAAHHLERVTSELQDIAMSLRMIPVSVVFRKMIRLVHDLSRKFGKKVELEMIGEDTEVDKTVVELISDPLVHIIRNALDHGIESPDERKSKGKDETGHVVLEARHDGGEVWILVRDDGRGLDREKILERAMAKGIISGEHSGIPDDRVYSLIFEPGFSTAEKITDVSGRGVGLDVVKNNLDKLKGKIEIVSKKDQGTTFILRIPLTLAIIDGMLVRVGTNFYIIPLLAIKESFVIGENRVTVTPDGHEYVNIRGNLLPLVRLHQFFNVRPENESLEQGILLTVQNDSRQIVLFIDEILEQQQTVIKGLPAFIGGLPGVSGCTILGDGQVSLILDIGSIADTSGKLQETKRRPGGSLDSVEELSIETQEGVVI